MWEKILDHLDEDNQFPLALSCRYFRQKQKELVARMRQNGYKGFFSLRTSLRRKLITRPGEGQPTSVKYLRFAKKEGGDRYQIRCLAAYHGHLPLLQDLLAGLKKVKPADADWFAKYAGRSDFHSLSAIAFSLFVSVSDFSFSLLRSARRPAGDLAVADNPGGV